MAKFRAIVSIEFDDEDLASLSEHLGIEPARLDPSEAINGVMDNSSFGNSWIEQIFQDGRATLTRISGGILTEIDPHDH
jgi:hypothetical protein